VTSIIFYSNVGDKFATLVVRVSEALRKRQQVTVLVENEAAAHTLHEQLWKQGATDFLPNALTNDPLAPQTPVVIHWSAPEGQENPLFQDDILINLTSEQPNFFSRFRELVELVSLREEDKLAARGRYKFYRDRGYEIKHIDQQAQSSASFD
jgi:DNA polymerase III subunit chi